MTTHELPTADRPDNYTGLHNHVHIPQGSVDPHTLTLHLCTGRDDTSGTYCTVLNPLMRVDLTSMRYSLPGGGHGFTGPGGATVGELLRRIRRLQWRGQPLTICPHCLTMARVEAEMISQRAYKVKTVTDAMGKLPDAHHAQPGN